MKRNAGPIILLLGLLAASADSKAQSQRSEKAQEAYARAHALFVERKFEESLAALNQALTANPKFVPALTLRAKLAMAINRLELARRDLNLAVELEPDSAYNQFMLGFYYYLENDFKRALEPLERARTLDPSSSRTHFYLALTHEGLANAGLAIQMYERALSLAKSGPDTDILIAYARLLFALGQYGKGLPLVEQALVLEPDSRDAHYERGRLFFQAGKFDRAVEEGEKALQLTSIGTTDRQIHFLLARAYGRIGNTQRAAAHLEKFQASAPTLRR